MELELTKAERLLLLSCLNQRKEEYLAIIREKTNGHSERMSEACRERLLVVDRMLDKLNKEELQGINIFSVKDCNDI